MGRKEGDNIIIFSKTCSYFQLLNAPIDTAALIVGYTPNQIERLRLPLSYAVTFSRDFFQKRVGDFLVLSVLTAQA